MMNTTAVTDTDQFIIVKSDILLLRDVSERCFVVSFCEHCGVVF